MRDPSRLRADVYAVLRDHGALCVHDMLDDHPREVTAGWSYLRYHGRDYAGGYPHQKLVAAADRIARRLSENVDVHAYFNNDIGGHAPADAADLRRYVEARRS